MRLASGGASHFNIRFPVRELEMASDFLGRSCRLKTETLHLPVYYAKVCIEVQALCLCIVAANSKSKHETAEGVTAGTPQQSIVGHGRAFLLVRPC